MESSNYIARYDAEPEFWQFLNGLTHDDLIAELVQNELDAESTRTSINFERDRFVCEGDGDPIDGDGWKRLSYIRGAGKQAPRKTLRIGVKNHGLKTCFTVGDEIVIRSDGKLFKQTLYENGIENDPAPATFLEPVLDSDAPRRGCRIEVPYRTKSLVTKFGEPLEFAAPTAEAIEQIFRTACREIPARFIGAIRPDTRRTYEIELRHFQAGTVLFVFRAAAGRSVRGGRFFTRSCTVRGETNLGAASIRESAFVFPVSLPTSSNHEIPHFYQSRGGFLAEVAWNIDPRGVPRPVDGALRYPIAYTGTGVEAFTGVGVHYSGPFVSDQERHGVSASAINPQITAACDVTLVRLMREHLVPKYGARALRLLIDPRDQDDGSRLRSLTAALINSAGIPLARRERGKIQFGPRGGGDGVVRPVVAPVFSWSDGKIAPMLVKLCPPGCDRIDSQLPSEIVALLEEEAFPGWLKTHVTFDDHDVLARMQPADEESFFPWPDEPTCRDQLGNPKVASDYLDVVVAICENRALTPDEVRTFRPRIHLPDSRGQARPMSELFIGNDLPPALSAIERPALLNHALAKHPLFRRRDWKLPVYSFEAFLDKIDFTKHSQDTRRAFSAWVRKNWKQVPARAASRLAAAPVWPAQNGGTHSLKELCLPSNSKIAAILSRSILLPATEVQGFRVLRRKGRGALVLRSAPTFAELNAYYQSRVGSFPRDRQLTVEEASGFRLFERELTTLASDRHIGTWLSTQRALGLSRARYVKRVEDLHRETPQIARLALLDGDVLDRSAPSLDRLFPARSEASLLAVIRAITEDPRRSDALIPRLKALVSALRRENSEDQPVAHVPCIPYGDTFVAPARLAFKGSRDYWGEWKISLPGKASADEQALYRSSGVTAGEPDFVTSLAFFEWINDQTQEVVTRHLEAIIRHFVHPRGVRQWWESYPDLACIPVRVGQELRLVSRRRALRTNGPVYLPDFEELAEAISDESANERVALVIDRHRDVSEPITQLMRDAGVRSLRLAAAAPVSITGRDPITATDAFQTLEHLRSSKMDNLRKRLVALDFNTPLRIQWRSRLQQVQSVVTASEVQASFSVGRRMYRIRTNHGFDETTHTIWLKRSATGDFQDSLFQAVTERVFEFAPKYAACVLQRAVRQEFRETQPLLVAAGEADEEPENTPDATADVEPGETSQTHRPAEPDPAKNLPRPGPIPQAPATAPLRGVRLASGNMQPKAASQRTAVELEDLHRADLKQNQYAWHCQVCLAAKSPRDLAPDESYVALAENRRKLIEAHHADQVHASGARHAGNLVVLCHHHHHQLGNALSREQISQALAATTQTKKVTFFAGNGVEEKRTICGYVISVHPPSLGSRIRFFFTTDHRNLWLEKIPRA